MEATKLQQARKALNVSVHALAQSAGVSDRATLFHLHGERSPGILTALCYAYCLQKANRKLGRPMKHSDLTPNALFLPPEGGGAPPNTTHNLAVASVKAVQSPEAD